MPPKKAALHTLRQAVPTVPPVWAVRTNTDVPPSAAQAWTPYSPVDSDAIERAYQSLKTASVSHGKYRVDTRQMRQFSATEALKQREVRRFSGSDALAAAVGKRRFCDDDAAGTGVRHIATGALVIETSETEDDEPGGQLAAPPQKKTRTEHINSSLLRSAPTTGSARTGSSDGTVTASDRSPLSRRASSASGVTNRSTIAQLPGSQTQQDPLNLLAVADTAKIPQKKIANAGVVWSRGSGGSFRVFLPEDTASVTHETMSTISEVLSNAEPISRLPLSFAAEKMHPATRNWLRLLGRKDGESGTFITLTTPLSDIPAAKRVPLTGGHTATAGELKQLANSAVITFVGKKPRSILRSCTDSSLSNSVTDEDYLQTQKLMVSGPVKVLYDSNYDCIKASSLPSIITCSIPGINFAYSATDSAAFTKLVEPDPDDDEEPMARARRRRVLDKDKAMKRMECIWDHVLRVLDEVHGVEYAVLCAIGCGAFKGSFGSLIPRLWAASLHRVLSASSKPFKNLKAVFVSLPTFADDNNFSPFAAVIENALKGQSGLGLRLPLVLMEDASMMAIACHIARAGPSSSSSAKTIARVGILNPSDVQAIRHGWIGMYWDGGHIALEELMALQTTMLTHHVGLNRDLFLNADRWVRSSSLDDA